VLPITATVNFCPVAKELPGRPSPDPFGSPNRRFIAFRRGRPPPGSILRPVVRSRLEWSQFGIPASGVSDPSTNRQSFGALCVGRHTNRKRGRVVKPQDHWAFARNTMSGFRACPRCKEIHPRGDLFRATNAEPMRTPLCGYCLGVLPRKKEQMPGSLLRTSISNRRSSLASPVKRLLQKARSSSA
jgi:hypothetical protein